MSINNMIEFAKRNNISLDTQIVVGIYKEGVGKGFSPLREEHLSKAEDPVDETSFISIDTVSVK